MFMKNKYLPTRESKGISLLIVILISLLQLVNTAIYSFVTNARLSSLIRAILWSGMVLLIWRLPKMRYRGKLKFQETLNQWAFNFAIIFVMISFGAGIIDGFGNSPYTNSIVGILMNILVIGSLVTGREFARSFLANSFGNSKNNIWLILLTLFMTFINIPIQMIVELKDFKDVVEYTAQYILPELSKNIMSLYLVLMGGPIPSIIYSGVIEAFKWLLPILPDLKWITTALIGTLCPIFFSMILKNIYVSETKTLKIREIEEEKLGKTIVISVACIAIVWFSLGVFPIYPSVIATGSMEPLIMPGDVILIDKRDIKDIKMGDVVQFKREDIYISHRIIEIVDMGSEQDYRTKGDNNSVADSELVREEQIKGKVVGVIPKIGWLKLIIISDENIDLKDVEF